MSSRLGKAYRAALFALLVSVVVTVGSNFVMISDAINETLFPSPKPVYIELLPYAPLQYEGVHDATEQQARDYLKDHIYISNYDAKILVISPSKYLEPKDSLSFHVSVKDTGINKLSQKKFLYILVFDPKGELASLFPSTFSGYTQGLPQSTKWPAPRDETSYNYDVIFNGTVDGREVWYRFSIPDDSSSIGTWRIYVVVFDDVYLDRWGKPITCVVQGAGYQFCPPDLDNAVTYTVIATDVLPESPPTQQSYADLVPWTIQILVPFVATYLVYWGRAREIEAALVLVGSKLKQHWIFVVVVAVLLACLLRGFI